MRLEPVDAEGDGEAPAGEGEADASAAEQAEVAILEVDDESADDDLQLTNGSDRIVRRKIVPLVRARG